MRIKEKSLEKRFLNGEKINFFDELKIKILQYVSDCDGICPPICNNWYCESLRGYNEKNRI